MRKPTAFKLFITAVIAVGLACLTWVCLTRTPDVIPHAPLLLWVMIGCVVVAELLPINVVLRGQEGELLTSTAFAFGVMIAFGAGAAVPVLCLASVVGDLARRKPPQRALFNVGQYAISLTVSGLFLEALTQVPREPLHSFVGPDLPL